MTINEQGAIQTTYREFRIKIIPEPAKVSQPQMKYIAVAKYRHGPNQNLQETFTAHGTDPETAESLVQVQIDAYWKSRPATK